MFENKKNIYLIILILLIWFIVIPLLIPGYIFWLDEVFNTRWWIPKLGTNVFYVKYISSIFYYFWIPIRVFQKIIIILTFILPVLGFYLLINKSERFQILFWLFFIIFNPFLYYRFLDWQINVYFSFALYPLFFYFVKKYFDSPNFKKAFFLGFYTLILSLTSLHNVIFLAVILLTFTVVYFLKYKNSFYVFEVLKLGGIIVLLNCSWFLPVKYFSENVSNHLVRIEKIEWKSLETFWYIPVDKNIYTESISTKGYWWMYKYKNNFLDTSFIIIIILFLVFLWFFYSYRKWLNYFEKSLLIIWVISFILWMWISQWNIFWWFNKYLFENISVYKWLREPNKWIMFLVIIFSYFWTYWIIYFWKILNKFNIKKYIIIIVSCFFIITPLIYTKEYFFYFHKEIKIKKYPQERLDIRSFLSNEWIDIKKTNCEFLLNNKSTKCYNVLSFPWHRYLKIDWVWKIIWWWVVNYFWNNILLWDNIEKGILYSESTRPESKIIEKYIWENWIFFKKNYKYIDEKYTFKEKKYINFIKDIKWLWIEYIILLRESDFKKYSNFLEEMLDYNFLELTIENEKIILYKVIY